MSQSGSSSSCLSRRSVLHGGLAGVGMLCLAACGESDPAGPPDPGDAATPEPTGDGTTPEPTDTAEDPTPEPTGDEEAPEDVLAAVDDIPVGGAVAVQIGDDPVLVCRPEEDTVVAFSAICTHQGCLVQPADGHLGCPCHGSEFSVTDGSVLSGPADSPLPQVEVDVVDGQVVAA